MALASISPSLYFALHGTAGKEKFMSLLIGFSIGFLLSFLQAQRDKTRLL